MSDVRMIYPKPAMTDEDVDFHSDILYFRDLLNAIVELAVETRRANPFPKDLSRDLAATRFWWPHNPTRKLLEAW